MERHTPLCDFPYSIGVLLAINAISDAFLLLDAPDCAFWKPSFIQGSHDWNSKLWSVDGRHRVHVSCVGAEEITVSRVKDIAGRLERMAALQQSGSVFAIGFPMVSLTGMQYDAVWRGLDPEPRKPFFEIKSGSMNDDWLDGYEGVLSAIAKTIDLPEKRPSKDNVAIVGYMMDRNEQDHAGNIEELRRMLAGIGLNLISVWLSGGRTSELADVAGAGTILSFPHAREPAEILARRLDVPVIECDVPLGFEHTSRWLLKIGEACGRRSEAESFIENELRRLLPRLEWVARDFFLHKKVVYHGDPCYVKPLDSLLNEFGARLLLSVTRATERRLEALGPWSELKCPVYPAQNEESLRILLKAEGGIGDFDFSIGSGIPFIGEKGRMKPFVEIGFPSYYYHSLYSSPFLGFEGCVCFLNRIVNTLVRPEQRPIV